MTRAALLDARRRSRCWKQVHFRDLKPMHVQRRRNGHCLSQDSTPARLICERRKELAMDGPEPLDVAIVGSGLGRPDGDRLPGARRPACLRPVTGHGTGRSRDDFRGGWVRVRPRSARPLPAASRLKIYCTQRFRDDPIESKSGENHAVGHQNPIRPMSRSSP